MLVDDPNYDGFRTFNWLAEYAGVPIDQLNFVITQFTALGLAGLLRLLLSPAASSPNIRHVFGLVTGLLLVYFSFGKQTMHLAGLPALCYVAIRTQDPHYVQRVVFAVALMYLSFIHFHRQMYDYGSYTMDITGPLMVITQKVTSLAYSMHDGLSRKQDELTPSQRHQAVKQIPNALEYFSYVFHFQTIMAGPVIFYRDYIDFIQGQMLLKKSKPHDEQNGQVEEIVLEPSPRLVVVKKVFASLLCAFVFVTLLPSYPIEKIKDDDFLKNTSMTYKYWYLIVATMLIRFKYYHAWIFADAICNNSGLGFNGFKKDGTPRWDLVTNVDALKFETALSLRESIDSWNKGTNRWLRMIVYERAQNNKTIFTYALSAFWHGFYPGYYLTFANGAFFTFVSRNVRRHFRPYFLTSQTKKVFYDALTLVTTRLVLAYITFSFILLEFKPSIYLYLNMYLVPHLFGLAAILVLPLFPRAREAGNSSGSHHHHHHHKAKPEKVIAELKAAVATVNNSNGHVHKDK